MGVKMDVESGSVDSVVDRFTERHSRVCKGARLAAQYSIDPAKLQQGMVYWERFSGEGPSQSYLCMDVDAVVAQVARGELVVGDEVVTREQLREADAEAARRTAGDYSLAKR